MSLRVLAGQALAALARLDDSLDAPRTFVDEREAEALRLLASKWRDTDRRIERELRRRDD